ncbi:colicin immunity protein Cui [Buttiauxella noackiae]|uniref:colicin immunity protein Cui n=1 Tax=Buttiauxella noackiae TaxID=82992 RepID=UPI0035A69DCC
MRSIENSKKPDNSIMIKYLLIILITTISPLIIAFIIYSNHPNSNLLKAIFEATSGFPALLSANNLLLSSVLNAWCKTAPFWGLVLFSLSFKHIQIKGGQSEGSMIKGLVLFSILYIPIVGMLLLSSAEITESGKIYRAMSKNDYLLTGLFMTIYIVCYTFTAFYLLMLAAVCQTINKKRKFFI